MTVWQRGVELSIAIYDICSRLPQSELYGICSQMKRAAVSIPSNIAEGHRRNDKKELRQFLGIALGSAAELETQPIITNKVYKDIDLQPALALNDDVQRMLHAFIA